MNQNIDFNFDQYLIELSKFMINGEKIEEIFKNSGYKNTWQNLNEYYENIIKEYNSLA